MGNQYRYRTKQEKGGNIDDKQRRKQNLTVDEVDINQSTIVILPEIDQRFKKEFEDYDSAIRDIKNSGKYNGKKLKPS